MKTPPIGLVHEATIRIDETLVVPRLPAALAAMADMPPVFATAYMVAFVEATCIEALAPYMEAGEGTVGTQINASHVAATPIGMTVIARIELIAAEGRKLMFRVSCKDERDTIGEGLHERFVIYRSPFMARVEAKLIAAHPCD
jgi:fluoroacetyl-CoA thioesterase